MGDIPWRALIALIVITSLAFTLVYVGPHRRKKAAQRRVVATFTNRLAAHARTVRAGKIINLMDWPQSQTIREFLNAIRNTGGGLSHNANAYWSGWAEPSVVIGKHMETDVILNGTHTPQKAWSRENCILVVVTDEGMAYALAFTDEAFTLPTLSGLSPARSPAIGATWLGVAPATLLKDL